MHELGIMMHIVETVEAFARDQGVGHIKTLVLQVGELSPVIPQYLRACYPAAVDGTSMQDTELEIEIVPGNGVCSECGKVYNIVTYNKHCPVCDSTNAEIISGREFLIKEIVAS